MIERFCVLRLAVHGAILRTIATFICFVSALSAPAAPPNIIVIYTDDQGYGDASCLNAASQFATPNIDRLAQEGLAFTDAHSPDTVCTPSRYGLLTGRYCWRTELKRGVLGAEHRCLVTDGRMTVASFLKQQGYNTAMVGKWHLGMDFPGDRTSRDWTKPVTDMPLDKGFDYFYGIPASMNYGVLAWFEGRYAAVPPTLYTSKKPNQIAIADYRIKPPFDGEAVDLGTTDANGVVRGPLEVAADFVDSQCLTRFTDKAIDWINSQADAARTGKPFFLYLPLTSPHKPVIPLDAFRGRSQAGAYGDFMMETDWHVGRILEVLDQQSLAHNTLVILTSDNGPENTWKQRATRYQHSSAGIYREGKRSIYEGGHRVPFVVRWPAGIRQPGRTCDALICQTDLLATFAEMLNTELPATAAEDSVSFAAVFAEEKQQHHRDPVVHHSANGRFAIRDDRWKLILPYRNLQAELYDLGEDPSETRNVVATNADIAQSLQARLSHIVKSGRTTPGEAQPNDTGWWSDLSWMERW